MYKNIGIRVTALLAPLVILAGFPVEGSAQLRPMAREMFENLGSVDVIGQALSIEDYERIEGAAADLKARANKLKDWSLERHSLNPARDDRFDDYLERQEKAASEILNAARRKDAQAVSVGLATMLEKSCLACHKEFREPLGLLSPATLFMNSFVGALQDVNRGLVLNDLSQVARSARMLASMGRVLSWDQVIASTFKVSSSKDRQNIRDYLNRVIVASERIEESAIRGETDMVTHSVTEMLNTGCLPCHKQYRKD